MAPFDMCAGDGNGAGGSGSGGGDVAECDHGRAAVRRPSCEEASNSYSKEPPQQESRGVDSPGERRKSRAAKLRETRSRNASRVQQQVYTSAEDSEEEEVHDEDIKPDLAMLQAEALLAPGVDKQAWKKQQRMIRNRESAALSRKRKRDRIESLEEQVARLVEENRGLKHRLAKYEASPQQARYKYARQSAPPSHSQSSASRPTSSSASGGRRNGSGGRGPAAGPPAGRNQGSGGVAAAFEGQDGGRGRLGGGGSNCGKPSTSTTAPVDTAAAADEPAAHGAQQPSASSSAHAMKPAPKKYHHPVVTVTAAAASASSAVAAGAPPAHAPLPSLVKMEVSSDCEGDGNLAAAAAPCASAAVIDGGYSSSSTMDDTPYSSEEEQQHQHLLSSDHRVEFDRDDNAACDSLLRDILGQQDGDGGDDDEFLSLLSDDGEMMIVNPASEGLTEGFVKREPNSNNTTTTAVLL